jgi:DNA-binding transcriptional ArsR family regulator
MSYIANNQDAFKAIADPGRRRILDAILLDEKSITDLVTLLGLSQAAVSQHVKVLVLAGLATARRQGRHTFYGANPVELRTVNAWLHKYERFWEGKLDALEAHLAQKIN